jgi:hypothetical protein
MHSPGLPLHNQPTMKPIRLMHQTAMALVLLRALPGWALSCDELQAEVEAKIRSNGVSQFSVAVVDANAAAPGKVVGSCDRGSKKLLYQPTGTAVPRTEQAAKPAAPSQRPPRREDPIPTECKDGSISMTGVCKKS